MGRTLVRTDARGWYIDAADPDGGKTRKQDGDDVFDNLIEAQSAQAVLEKAHGGATENGAAKPEPPTTVAETGKKLVGKTLTIRCQWKDGSKRCPNTRTIKPQDAFQVKYCVEHQKERQKQLRREKQRARSAARKKEREKAKASA